MAINNENDSHIPLNNINEDDGQNENNQIGNFGGQSDNNQNDGESHLINNDKKDIFKEPCDKIKKYQDEIDKLKIFQKNSIENLDKNDTSVIFSSFFNKILDITDSKVKYEDESSLLKRNFYKCKFCKCCGCILDCFCSNFCNYELTCPCCCCCSCCSCCSCFKLSVVDTEQDKREDYISKMNTFKNDEENISKSLEELIIEYFPNSQKENGNHEYICENKCDTVKYYIFFIIFSLLHYFVISIIQAVLFSLLREIFRAFYFFIYEKYQDDDKKDFIYYLKISSKNDSSQINFNYLSAFITDFFVSKTNIIIPYFVSFIGIIILFLFMLLFDFLNIKDITEKRNYSEMEIVCLCIFYIFIYTFTGIISLYPVYIIKQSPYYTNGSILLSCILLTSSVCAKFAIHGELEFSFNWHLYIICGYFFFILIYPIIFLLMNCFNCCTNNTQITFEDKIKDLLALNKIKIPIEKGKKEEDEGNLVDNKNLSIKENKYYSASYSLGYLTIGTEFMKFSIKIKGFGSYLASIFKSRISLFLLINFAGRAQKIKFKIDYKGNFNEEFWLLIGNFFISLGIYLLIYLCIFICCDKWKENSIIIILGIENILICLLTVISFFSDCSAISYCAISISGCVNYILYEYYSTIEIEYITASGFISLPQVIFRFIELFLKCDGLFWIWWQIGCTIVGLIANIIYYCCFLKRDEKK